MDKTKQDMQHRLSQLLALRKSQDMSLRTSAELDAIQNHGLNGWNEFLRKQRMRKGK